MEIKVTDLPNRKVTANIERGGSVTIRKHYQNKPEEPWNAREITLGSAEWEKIDEERRQIVGK